MVSPAIFKREGRVADWRSTLSHRSEQRREKDPRFDSYSQLLDRVKAMNETREVSLHVEERKKMARAERELRDWQEKLNPDSEDQADGKRNIQNDLVLQESLKICADLIELASGSAAEPLARTAPLEKRRLSEAIADWLRK